jgi:non-homologous end joining protein Ku
MAARAIWKGELKIGTQKLPVNFTRPSRIPVYVSTYWMARKRNRVKQHMVQPESGEEVETKDIRKGYEIEPGNS